MRAQLIAHGAAPGTDLRCGKQNQFAALDGVLYHNEGDGRHRYPGQPQLANGQIYNAVDAWDFRAGGEHRMLCPEVGNPADGTVPCLPQGGGWVANPDNGDLIQLPGYIERFSGDERYDLMQDKFAYVHHFNTRTNSWRATCNFDLEWWPLREFWGAALNRADGIIYRQSAVIGNYGGLCRYDTKTERYLPPIKFTAEDVDKLEWLPGLGKILDTDGWRHCVNHATNELLCCDWYRGWIVGVNLTTFKLRHDVAYIGKLHDRPWPGDFTEPLRTIESGMDIDEAGQRLFVCASNDGYFADPGEAFDIGVIDLTTGEKVNTDYPLPDMSWTSCAWVANKLVLADNSAAEWQPYFLIYEDANV